MRGRWERVREFVLWHDQKEKKRARESNMSSRHCDSVLCPLGFDMSQTIFKNHQTRSHIHHRVYNTPRRCTATIIEFLCLGICTDNMWSPLLIPYVKSHYSCRFPLIDSSFLHFISWLHAQAFISGLQSHLFWRGLIIQETVKSAKGANVWTGELEKETGNKNNVAFMIYRYKITAVTL